MKEFIPTSYQIKDLDEKGVVVFLANAFNNVDSDKDISLPGSFKKTLSENFSRLRHFKYHDPRLMPGAIKEAIETNEGLQVASQLILKTQLGSETYEEYKAMIEAGKQMEHSIGVNAIKAAENKSTGVREVSEWKLWEVSTLTAWGANDKAGTLSVKSLEDMTREEMERELMYLKALLNISSYSDLQLEHIEKQINYLKEVKAGLGAAEQHSDSTTLAEWKQMLNLNL